MCLKYKKTLKIKIRINTIYKIMQKPSTPYLLHYISIYIHFFSDTKNNQL